MWNMIKALFTGSSLTTSILKYGLTGIASTASFYAVIDHYETKGYNRAKVELQGATNEAVQKATQQAIKDAEKKMQEALTLQQQIFDMELARANEHKEVEVKTKEIIKYVDRIKIKTECSTVSDDVIKLLNNSISNSNKASK